MQLSGKKLTTAILAGLMGATMFGSSVFADDAQRLTNVEVLATQNKSNIDTLKNDVQALKDASTKDTYSKDEVDNKLADKANQSDVTTNTNGIATNKQAISDEATARQTADADLQKGVDANKQAISDEATARQTADADLQKGVDANKQAISDEATARQNADADLQKGVDANKQAISDEATARQTADADLQKGVDANKQAIADETTARQTDVANLQTNIKDALTNQGIVNDTLTQAVQANSNAIVTSSQNLEKHLKDTDGRVDQANAEIHTNAGNIAQNKQDIATNTANIQKNSEAVAKVQEDYTTVKDTVQFIKDNKDAIDNVNTMKTQLDATTAVADNNHEAIQNEISDRQNADAAEKKAREDADSQLNTKLTNGFATIQGQQDEQDAKIAKNQKDIQTNAGNIQKNTDAIKTNSDKLADHEERISSNAKNIENNAESIKKETNDRIDADTALQKNIDKEASDRAAADSQLNTKMTNGFATIQGQQDEQDAKIAKNQKDIQTNAGNIQKNTDAIKTNSDKLADHEERISSNAKNIENNAESIKKETNGRIDADAALQKNIDKEASDRAAADRNLQTQINNNNTSVNNEAAERKDADQNLQNQINNNSTSINDLYGRYSSLKTDINKVGARSAALAGLHPLDFDPANKLNFAVASGSFKGENSVALGAFYRPNENIMFSAASTMGDSDNAYTFGLSFKIGPSSAKTKTTSPDAEELYKVVGELQDQLAAQQKEIEQLKANKAK